MQPPAEEIRARVGFLQEDLRREGLSAAIIMTRLNLYYFSGTTYLDHLIIPSEGETLALSRQKIPIPSPWRTVATSRKMGLSQLMPEIAGPGQVGLELDVLPVNNYRKVEHSLPGYTFVDVSRAIRWRRAVKTPWELGVLRETAKKDLTLWRAVPEFLSRAATDLELTAEMEAAARKQGHQGLLEYHSMNDAILFNTVLAGEAGLWAGPWDTPLSGPGLSPTYPQGANGSPLLPGQPILIDYLGCYHGYILDQSRLFAKGYLPPELIRAYGVARRIQEAVIAAVRPGARCGDLYSIAASIAEEAGLTESFMGPKRVSYIGHGVGLELDELPVLARGFDTGLQVGMVFALEPKFAIAGHGAVGLENTWAVTEDGVEKLSLATDELIVV